MIAIIIMQYKASDWNPSMTEANSRCQEIKKLQL